MLQKMRGTYGSSEVCCSRLNVCCSTLLSSTVFTGHLRSVLHLKCVAYKYSSVAQR